MDLPTDPVESDLVRLETLDAEAIADLLAEPPRRHDDWHAEFPRQDDRDGVGMVREVSGWTSRAIRERASGLVVGTIGFFGPPEPADDGVPEVEVGYGLVAPVRGRGLMRSSLAALMQLTDAAGVRVRGSTTRANAASLASLRGAGFVLRRDVDDDPEREVELVRPLP